MCYETWFVRQQMIEAQKKYRKTADERSEKAKPAAARKHRPAEEEAPAEVEHEEALV